MTYKRKRDGKYKCILLKLILVYAHVAVTAATTAPG